MTNIIKIYNTIQVQAQFLTIAIQSYLRENTQIKYRNNLCCCTSSLMTDRKPHIVINLCPPYYIYCVILASFFTHSIPALQGHDPMALLNCDISSVPQYYLPFLH